MTAGVSSPHAWWRFAENERIALQKAILISLKFILLGPLLKQGEASQGEQKRYKQKTGCSRSSSYVWVTPFYCVFGAIFQQILLIFKMNDKSFSYIEPPFLWQCLHVWGMWWKWKSCIQWSLVWKRKGSHLACFCDATIGCCSFFLQLIGFTQTIFFY